MGGQWGCIFLGRPKLKGMHEVQGLVLVAFITGAAIVIVCVMQAKCLRDVSKNVRTRDELQLAVDRRAHLVGNMLMVAGIKPDDTLTSQVNNLAADSPVARALEHIGNLPVLESGLRGMDEDAGHMVLVDSATGHCVVNAPSRRVTAAALNTTPVDLNDMHTAPFRQQVVDGEAGTQAQKQALMPRIRAKVAGGGGHVSYTAAGSKGKRRWHTYFAQIPKFNAYLGASAPVG